MSNIEEKLKGFMLTKGLLAQIFWSKEKAQEEAENNPGTWGKNYKIVEVEIKEI